LGVDISVDDFGMGYFSLLDFKQIPADELKISPGLISSIGEDSPDLELVRIIIKIARLFDLNLVGNGIRDQKTYDHLKKLGCDYGQGRFISKVLSAENISNLMRS
ncbi:MAG: EAL domain-containing protein, partial [Gammaproteobacteria bacterium]|nr:EAL domain-containing protein [Gammaproteobacteria bacterium]